MITLKLIIDEFIYAWQFYVELVKLLVNGELFDPELLFSIVGSILPLVIFSAQMAESEYLTDVTYERILPYALSTSTSRSYIEIKNSSSDA